MVLMLLDTFGRDENFIQINKNKIKVSQSLKHIYLKGLTSITQAFEKAERGSYGCLGNMVR